MPRRTSKIESGDGLVDVEDGDIIHGRLVVYGRWGGFNLRNMVGQEQLSTILT
jgi:hypothetical protein